MKAIATIILALLSLTLLGCAGSFETARSYGLSSASAESSGRERCESLDAQRTTWGAVAKGAAVLAGSGGIAALPIESEDAQTALAIGALTAGTVSIISVYVAEQKGEAWARECSR